jgi:hypothetical protein
VVVCVCVCKWPLSHCVPLPLHFVATARNLAPAGRGSSIRTSPTGTGGDRDLSSGLVRSGHSSGSLTRSLRFI